MSATTAAVGVATAVLGAVVAVVDVRERRIPNGLVGIVLAVGLAIGAWRAIDGDPRWGWMAAGLLGAGGMLLVLHLVNPAGMGFGDVKLAAALGALLGTVHWMLALVMLMLASIGGAIVAIGVRSWRCSMPFGACLAAGAVLALAAGRWFLGRLGMPWPD